MPGARKPPIKPNLAYCCSFNLLLFKFFEVVCTLASLILSLAFEGNAAIILIEIFSALSFVTAFSWVILYSLNLNARFPSFFPTLLLVYHLLMCALNVVAAVCGAILWPQFIAAYVPNYIVCTFTSGVAAILFLVDAIFNLMTVRGSITDIQVCCCSPWEEELSI